MANQINDKKLYRAYVLAELGDSEHYDCWTPLWAVRSRIWSKGELRKQARNSFGELVLAAVAEGESSALRKIADALDIMKIFERSALNTLRADIFYAVEELNQTRPAFSRKDVLELLNGKLEAPVTAEELDRELALMRLDMSIPEPPRAKPQTKKAKHG